MKKLAYLRVIIVIIVAVNLGFTFILLFVVSAGICEGWSWSLAV